jgi:hypothetical protein
MSSVADEAGGEATGSSRKSGRARGARSTAKRRSGSAAADSANADRAAQLLQALEDLAAGDFQASLDEAGDPVWAGIAHAFNRVVETNRNIYSYFSRIIQSV